jgi:hypothetical protein
MFELLPNRICLYKTCEKALFIFVTFIQKLNQVASKEFSKIPYYTKIESKFQHN